MHTHSHAHTHTITHTPTFARGGPLEISGCLGLLGHRARLTKRHPLLLHNEFTVTCGGVEDGKDVLEVDVEVACVCVCVCVLVGVCVGVCVLVGGWLDANVDNDNYFSVLSLFLFMSYTHTYTHTPMILQETHTHTHTYP